MKHFNKRRVLNHYLIIITTGTF